MLLLLDAFPTAKEFGRGIPLVTAYRVIHCSCPEGAVCSPETLSGHSAKAGALHAGIGMVTRDCAALPLKEAFHIAHATKSRRMRLWCLMVGIVCRCLTGM